MTHKKSALLLAVLFIMVCTGCGKPSRKETVPQVPQTETYQGPFQTQGQPENWSVNQTTEVPEAENPASGAELLKNGALNGTVVEFYDKGCRVTPTLYEEDIAYQAAPGYESELIPVVYEEGCTFQIANVNPQTGAVTYEEASVRDIGKQVSLVIFGEYDSSNVLHGERVFIYCTVR